MLFNYRAYTQTGELKEGQIEALSQNLAVTALQKQDLFVSSLEPAGWQNKLSQWQLWNQVSGREIVLLSRQLAALFAAKASVLEIFRMLAEDTENQSLAEILNQIGDDIQRGVTISDAMARHSQVFSSFYVNMVKAGEESGTLDSILLYLADYQERNHALLSQAKQALIYPALIIIVAVAVMVLTFSIINNYIIDLLQETQEEIPFFTEVVMNVSQFAARYGLWVLVILAFGSWFFFRWLQTSHGRQTLDRMKLDLPVFGPLLKKLYLSQIADTLYTMITSGVQLTRTLEVASEVVNNQIYKDILTEAVTKVRQGETLSQSLARHQEISPAMIQITKVGEETGSLAKVLKTLADFYRRDFIAAMQSALTLIQPVIIVFLGLWVATIMLAIIVPIYTVATAL